MKKAVTIAVLVLGASVFVSSAILLTGCANISHDDRDFFYRTWLHPSAAP
jgi:hypothetical protein